MTCAIFSVLLVFTLVTGANGILCYTGSKESCSSAFFGLFDCPADKGCDYCGKAVASLNVVVSGSAVTRTCGKGVCVPASLGLSGTGVGNYCCYSSLCNSAPKTQTTFSSSYVYMSASVLMAMRAFRGVAV